MKVIERNRAESCLKQTFKPLLAVPLLLLMAAPALLAATKTWDGSLNNLWSAGANWSGNSPPANGDDLVFPSGATNKDNLNDNVNLRLNSISLTGSGYNLGGNSLTVTNGVRAEQASGGNTISFDLYLAGSQTFECVTAGASVAVNGFIALWNSTLTVTNNGDMTFAGVISGAGGVVRQGSGILTYLGNSDNIYNGPTDVRGGILVLGKTSLAQSLANSALTISNATVRESVGGQIGYVPITINKGGLLDLNGFDDTIGNSLTLNDGGDVQTGAGTLSLPTGTAVTVNPGPGTGEGSTISGKLQAYGPDPCAFAVAAVVSIWANGLSIPATVSGVTALRKTSNGIMYLSASNGFTGTMNVEAGTLAITHSHALGDTSAGTTVSNTATLRVSENINVSGEALILASTDANGALTCTGGTNTWDGTVTLAADAVINIFTNARLNLSNVLGGGGGLTKTGPGTLVFSGASANTYLGNTVVNEGALELDKGPTDGAIPNGTLTIGDGTGGINADIVREMDSYQIGSIPITINNSGLLDLNGFSDTVGALTFNGGKVMTGAGTLSLAANVTVNANTNAMAAIAGKLLLPWVHTIDVTGHYWSPDISIAAAISGPGGLVKNGPGELSLSGSNSYDGAVTVNAGYLGVDNDWALGSTNAGTTVGSSAVLLVRANSHVGLEALSLNGSGVSGWGALSARTGSNSWAGNVTLAGNSTVYVYSGDSLNLSGSVGGAGDLTKTGTGTLIFSGGTANSYGDTFVNAGTLALAKSTANVACRGTLVIGDSMGGAGADVVRVEGPAQIHDQTAVTVSSSGTLDVSGVSASEVIGSLAGSGHVVLGSKRLDAGKNDASTTYAGLISGAGGSFYKQGLGTMTLSGDNTYSGETAVLQGTLLVNGSQPASMVGMLPAAILGGTGTVGDILAYGVLSPGTSPGILTCSNVALNAGSTLRVELNGTLPGAFGYDQLNVRGTNNLGGATLEVVLGFTPAKDDAFTILNNDGHDAIVGTFAGLTNGATFSVGLADFQINYDGDTGNDVVLTTTRVYPALVITNVTPAGTNLDLRWTSSRPDYVVERATALETNMAWQAVAGPMKDTKATVPMNTTNGFYRVRGGN